MKIIFVCSGNKLGKPGLVVYNQALSLKQQNVEIDFFLITRKGLRGYLGAIIPLYKEIKRKQFDIIHSHYSLSSFVASFALLIPGAPKIPHVVSLMGSDTKLVGCNKKLVQLFSKRCWNAIIVKSSSMYSDVALKEAVIIPNGVDLNIVKDRVYTSKNKERKTILFAADPSRESKNYPLAQSAFQLIESNTIELKVVYNVAHEQIINEINNADVLLLTSKWEGSPNIIKEAMACNCPIVATDVGDVQWVLGETGGCYVSSFEPQDVAAKLQKALEYSEKYGRTQGRKRLIALGLNSETIAKRLIDVYKSVLQK